MRALSPWSRCVHGKAPARTQTGRLRSVGNAARCVPGPRDQRADLADRTLARVEQRLVEAGVAAEPAPLGPERAQHPEPVAERAEVRLAVDPVTLDAGHLGDRQPG